MNGSGCFGFIIIAGILSAVSWFRIFRFHVPQYSAERHATSMDIRANPSLNTATIFHGNKTSLRTPTANVVALLALVKSATTNVNASITALRAASCADDFGFGITILAAGKKTFDTLVSLGRPQDQCLTTKSPERALRDSFAWFDVVIETDADKAGPPASSGADSDRILRLARLRNVLRRQALANPKERLVRAYIIADLDVEMPTPAQVAFAVQQVESDDGWDVICANGRAGHHWANRFYDIFALVPLDWSYPYQQIWKNTKTITAVGKDKLISLHEFQAPLLSSFGTIGQGNLDANGKSDLGRLLLPNKSVIQVRSCFGGFAAYSRMTFADPGCSYTIVNEQAEKYRPNVAWHDTISVPCEHIVFHLCLGHHGAKVGVAPAVLTWWGGS